MKTTIDLPEELVREMKLRAVRERRKLKDVAAEAFRAGLRASARSATEGAKSAKLDEPLFVCEEGAAKAPGMTVEDLLRLQREAELEEDLRRAGHPL